METVDIVDNVEVKTCDHRRVTRVSYICNDKNGPPVISVSGAYEMTIISLTNQVIRVSCAFCFERIRRAATKLTPETWRQLRPQ